MPEVLQFDDEDVDELNSEMPEDNMDNDQDFEDEQEVDESPVVLRHGRGIMKYVIIIPTLIRSDHIASSLVQLPCVKSANIKSPPNFYFEKSVRFKHCALIVLFSIPSSHYGNWSRLQDRFEMVPRRALGTATRY